MGSAASKALSASMNKVSDDDLKSVFVSWPKEERGRLQSLLKKSEEEADQKASDSKGETASGTPVIKVAISPASTEAPTPEKPEASKPAGPEKLKELDATQTGKFHSAVRWGKTQAEIEAVVDGLDGATVMDCAGAVDEKNGNTALHIAAQNGHMHLTRWLCEKGLADVNAQNFKGQTPMHMSVAYDFYFQSKMMIEEFKADQDLKNGDGHKAISGIDGDKVDGASWDCGLNILKAAGDDKEELTLAFDKLMQADPKDIDKADLGATGMKKKKLCPKHWDADRFKQIMQRV